MCISARESIDVCLQTLQQNSAKWKEERSLRITASNAYQLYTYYKTDPCKPKDWKRKVTKLILPDDLTTPAIEHGRKCESKAINVYSDATGKTVSRCGLVVPPNVPWIGCSPDGLIIEEKKIVEIKCPLAGKSSSIDDLLPNLAYLTKSTMTLRRTHQYFAQVQLNMYILNCTSADQVIFSEYSNKCHIITQQYDHDYVISLLNNLKEVYFNVYLKYLYMLKN